MYLDENPTEIPWDAIRYLIAEAGGLLPPGYCISMPPSDLLTDTKQLAPG